MDWSKIKTIFIISFLVLDIYLMYEFFKIEVSNQYNIETETSIESWLKAENIQHVPLPTGYLEEAVLKARPKVFTDDDLKKTLFLNQEARIISSTILESALEDPIKVKDRFEPSELSGFIKSHILYGDQYRYWEKDDKESTITYYQQYKGKPFYRNLNGKLIFHLNNSNEVTSYRQTFLEDIKALSEPDKIIQPIKALETLYINGNLKPNSKITKIELGFYTFVPLSDTTQVMNPTWCFVIDNKERLFVSAYEGKIVDLEKEKLVME